MVDIFFSSKAYDQPDCYETSELPESDQYADYNEVTFQFII